ncbi:MAG: hypothetical protein JNN07_12555 [Verrucomicrobiales bacterium]|nr:hypothetical protein [Verrucomicrobiales bacterium]
MNGPSNPASGPQRFLLTGVVILFCAYAVWDVRQRAHQASAAAQRDIAALRAQLDARDEVIQDLKTSVRQLQGVVGTKSPGTGRTPSSPVAVSELDWVERLHDLELRQSNMVAMVERLADKIPDGEALDQMAGQLEALLLREELAEGDQSAQAEGARQRVAELLLSLSVPADVAELEPSKALENSALQAYWPYFEARQQSEVIDGLVIRMRAATSAGPDRGGGGGRQRPRSVKP